MPSVVVSIYIYLDLSTFCQIIKGSGNFCSNAQQFIHCLRLSDIIGFIF